MCNNIIIFLLGLVVLAGTFIFLQDLDLKSLIIEAYFKGQQVFDLYMPFWKKLHELQINGITLILIHT